MGDPRELFEFEAAELQLFLDDYFQGKYAVTDEPLSPGEEYFEGWNEHQAQWEPLLRDKTSHGLENGIRMWLEHWRKQDPSENHVLSVYQTDIGEFVHYKPLVEEVARTVSELSFLPKEGISIDTIDEEEGGVFNCQRGFAQDVSSNYTSFLYRESRRKAKDRGLIE